MKRILCLLLFTSSIFSMQLDMIKNNCLRLKTIHQKLVKHHSPKLDIIKQHYPQSSNDTKQRIEPSSFFASRGLGKIKLYHDEIGMLPTL